MRSATKVFSVFSIIKFIIIVGFALFIAYSIKESGSQFNFEEVISNMEAAFKNNGYEIDLSPYYNMIEMIFNLILEYTLIFIIIEVGVNILTICTVSRASKVFLVILGLVKLLLLIQLLSGLFTLLSAFTEPEGNNNYNYNGYNNGYNNGYGVVPNNPYDSVNYIKNNGHNQLYKSSWKPTGIVPQRSYRHSRPNISTICIVLCTIGTILVICSFTMSYWCLIPAAFLFLAGITNNKEQVFMKRCDKIIKIGMTYDEVIYIMEGFSPKSSGYTHDGSYCLDYMIGRKEGRRDFEQRRFYFDQNGILIDTGEAYHRTYRS